MCFSSYKEALAGCSQGHYLYIQQAWCLLALRWSRFVLCRRSRLRQKPFNPLADIAIELLRKPRLREDAVEVMRRTRVPTPTPLLVQSSQSSEFQSLYSRVEFCGDPSSFELFRVQHAHIARRVQAAHLYVRWG